MNNLLFALTLLISSVFNVFASADCKIIPTETVVEMVVLPRNPVQSSNIASIGYDEVRYILEVEFRTGSVYQYYNVPKSVYKGLINASSHGTYLGRYVKDVYRYRKVN